MSRLKPLLSVYPLLGAFALAGCVSTGGPTATANSSASNAFASLGTSTVAFESVDGPPSQVFERLVSALDSEAKLRSIPVASREGASTYRVRSYLSAQIRGKRTTIAWTWDVYDGNQQRALRLTGEEIGTRNGPDAWAAADDTVIRRIAQAGLSGLSPLLNGQASPSAPAVRETGPALADAEIPPPVTSGFAAR